MQLDKVGNVASKGLRGAHTERQHQRQHQASGDRQREHQIGPIGMHCDA